MLLNPLVRQVDLTGIQLSLTERHSDLPHTARAVVTGVIPDPQPVQQQQDQAGNNERRAVEELLVLPPAQTILRPQYWRLAPPLFLREDEMIWQVGKGRPGRAEIVPFSC